MKERKPGEEDFPNEIPNRPNPGKIDPDTEPTPEPSPEQPDLPNPEIKLNIIYEVC